MDPGYAELFTRLSTVNVQSDRTAFESPEPLDTRTLGKPSGLDLVQNVRQGLVCALS